MPLDNSSSESNKQKYVPKNPKEQQPSNSNRTVTKVEKKEVNEEKIQTIVLNFFKSFSIDQDERNDDEEGSEFAASPVDLQNDCFQAILQLDGTQFR